jgi:hypothetical protein
MKCIGGASAIGLVVVAAATRADGANDAIASGTVTAITTSLTGTTSDAANGATTVRTTRDARFSAATKATDPSGVPQLELRDTTRLAADADAKAVLDNFV